MCKLYVNIMFHLYFRGGIHEFYVSNASDDIYTVTLPAEPQPGGVPEVSHKVSYLFHALTH